MPALGSNTKASLFRVLNTHKASPFGVLYTPCTTIYARVLHTHENITISPVLQARHNLSLGFRKTSDDW